MGEETETKRLIELTMRAKKMCVCVCEREREREMHCDN